MECNKAEIAIFSLIFSIHFRNVVASTEKLLGSTQTYLFCDHLIYSPSWSLNISWIVTRRNIQMIWIGILWSNNIYWAKLIGCFQ